MSRTAILVTGGTGYIGSHTVLELLKHPNVDVQVIDSLVNSSAESLARVRQLSGRDVVFAQIDLKDADALDQFFAQSPKFDAVIHFAGLKAVGESVQKPLMYYQNNIAGTLNLLECMEKYGCRNIIFSSSATVYGNPETIPTPETARTEVTNTYGRTKLFIEQVLYDLSKGETGKLWKIVVLRYFNPVGAHPSGLMGEDPNGIPNNLLPFIAQVAVGRIPKLRVFGSNYKTIDGTGVRDYIHVVDLARGHAAALFKGIYERMQQPGAPTYDVYNLGSGVGTSVLQMVKFMESAASRPIPVEMVERRAGDVDEIYADSTKANKELDWRTELSIEEAVADTWRWQSQNPMGYQSQGRVTPASSASAAGGNE